MSVYLRREETVVDIEQLRSIKESHKGSTVVSEGFTYKVTAADYTRIEVISATGESSFEIATNSHPKYTPAQGLFSNGVVWQGDAYFMSNGCLWALNLPSLSWRPVESVRYREGRPLWETSNSDDLLLLTDETSGTMSFARFRPSFDDCQFVINYTIRILSASENREEILRSRNGDVPDGIVTIPWTLEKAIIESAATRYTDGKVPMSIVREHSNIGTARQPYPRSQTEAAEIWKQFFEKEDEIEQLRSRVSTCAFSRECPICTIPNPSVRAAFIVCGHLCCLACAKQLEHTERPMLCPLCRKETAFVRIYEVEEEQKEDGEVKNESVKMKKDEKRVANGLSIVIDPLPILDLLLHCFIARN